MFDWQSITVALIVLAALAYVARRGWSRLRSFTARGGASSCASGCGSCGAGERRAGVPVPNKAFVRLSRQNPSASGAKR